MADVPKGGLAGASGGDVSEGTGPVETPSRINGRPTIPSVISGLGGALKDLFANKDKVIRSKTDKPTPRDIQPHYKFDEAIDKRILGLADYYYREGSFEKIQFARKWMRNALIYQGYHELEWSEINVAWDIVLQDSGDYAFPNNYYRSLIQHGVRAYVQNEPLIEPVPSNDDAAAEAATKAARTALDIIKKSIGYEHLRVLEAINLRLFGNSFRFNYYSKDPRYGYVSGNVYQDRDVILSHGGSMCPQCGPMEGDFQTCPYCGNPISDHTPPVVSSVPVPSGTVTYPRGEIVTECVNPLEIYMRSSSYDLWHAPFIIRNRVVDRLSLQSAYPDLLLAPKGDEGGGEAYSTGGDLGLIYLQTLADLPGDPTQYAAWYERATAAAKTLLIEAWLRPSTYFFDKTLREKFPDGLYIAKTGDTLLEARNDTIEDHWTHYVYIPVPGRVWGDGDDDLIPCQLKLDEEDRLIQRNQGYNSAPLIAIDSQRIDKNEILNDPSTIIEVKSSGKPIKDAFSTIDSKPLSQESWQWRNAQLVDMMFHSRVSPSAVGQHQAGVNTFGGQESMAAKSDNSLLPQMMIWKVADERWAEQVLKLASANWLDERTNAVMGINGRWEFEKLRGSALDLDNIKIVSRCLPIDPTQQSALSEAVAAGLLNPQDPRVMRKALELFHLPTELDSFYMDSKVQWKEIEKMKQSGMQVQPLMIRDNDAVHVDICRVYLNSDEAEANPQVAMLVLQHAQLHMLNMLRQQQMAAVIQGGAMEAQNAVNPQPADMSGAGQPGGQPGGKAPSGGGGEQKPQGGKQGGQKPTNPVTRQQRAQKGAAAKPHRPQPSSGNQYARRQLT
jgi:hypothetical protein